MRAMSLRIVSSLQCCLCTAAWACALMGTYRDGSWLPMPCREHTVHYEDGEIASHDLSLMHYELVESRQEAAAGTSAHPSSSAAAAAPAAAAAAAQAVAQPPPASLGAVAAAQPAVGAAAAQLPPAAPPGAAAQPVAQPPPVATPGAAAQPVAQPPPAAPPGAAAQPVAQTPPAAHAAAPGGPAAVPSGTQAGQCAQASQAPPLPAPDQPEVAGPLAAENEEALMPIVEVLLEVAAWAGVPAAQVSSGRAWRPRRLHAGVC